MTGRKEFPEWGPVVVDARIEKVTTRLYRALQSFAYSSMRTRYVWNVGIHLFKERGEFSWEDRVIFKKPGKWVVEVVQCVFQRPPEDAKCETYVALTTGRGYIKYDGVRVEVADPVASFQINAYENPVELERTYLVPERDLPFAEPLSLAEIVYKLAEYYDAAQRHIDEEVRAESARELEKAEAKSETAEVSG
jgi:hypothetical protein